MSMTRTLPALTLLALGAVAGSAQAQTADTLPQSWMELIGLVPAPTYDWENSAFPRRRPTNNWKAT